MKIPKEAAKAGALGFQILGTLLFFYAVGTKVEQVLNVKMWGLFVSMSFGILTSLYFLIQFSKKL